MLISSLLWGIGSSLDSGLLATAVKVSKSYYSVENQGMGEEGRSSAMHNLQGEMPN